MDLLRDARSAALDGRLSEAITLGQRAVAAGGDGEQHARQQLVEWLLAMGRGVMAHQHARKAVELLRPHHQTETRVSALACYAYAASFVGDGQAALRAGTPRATRPCAARARPCRRWP